MGTKSLLDQLADKFTVGDDCWIWTGARTTAGYGNFGRQGKTYLAHRVVYELLVGPIPEGLELDHLCCHPSCVRPAHLEPVTHVENMRRAGMPFGAALAASKRTHCPRGHLYDETNTRVWHRMRYCRACDRARTNRRYHARKAAAR